MWGVRNSRMTLLFVTGQLFKKITLREGLVCVCVSDENKERMSLFCTYCVCAGWNLNKVITEKRVKNGILDNITFSETAVVVKYSLLL